MAARMALVYGFSLFLLSRTFALKLNPAAREIILTKSAMSTGITTSKLPKNLLVHELDGDDSHVHLLLASKKKKFTQQQLDEISLDFAISLDEVIEEDKSVLVTASNFEQGSAPPNPASILKRARIRHLKTYLLDKPMNTQECVSCRSSSSPPFSVSDCKVVDHAFIDLEEATQDVSEIVCVDGLVCSSLRKALLDIISPGDEIARENRVDEKFWTKGAYDDVAGKSSGGYGLKPEMMEVLNKQDEGGGAGAVTELGRRIQMYLEEVNDGEAVRLTKLPSAVFGPQVAPLGGNAPTHADSEGDSDAFGWHIDGDPNLTPPGAFRDCYGLYGNRLGGDKPRFISALVYLNEEWKPEWDGGTEFLDPPTSETYTTQVEPGRVVLLDSDITHRVTTPAECAGGNRPRYSLVLKLLLRKEKLEKGRKGGGVGDIVMLAKKTTGDKYIGSAASLNKDL
jgi:hypothetical protein